MIFFYICTYTQNIVIMNDDVLVKRPDVKTPSVEIDTKKLDSWLIDNLHIMETLTFLEPTCWLEVDDPE